MRKIGLLGGSFNPAHQGHIHISLMAKKKLGLDQIWWLPTVQNPLKNKTCYRSFENRVDYCQSLLQKNLVNSRLIKIFTVKYKYSLELVKFLKLRNRNCDFYWIMGADNVSNLHLWKNYYNFIKSVKIVIFARNSDLTLIKKTRSWKLLNIVGAKIFFTQKLNISSTFIRDNNV